MAKQELNKIITKIPFVSKAVNPKVDVFGEEQKQNSLLEQFFSPGYSKGKNDSPVLKEIERLYNIDKNTDVFPGTDALTSGKFSENKADYIMTADEFTKFKKTYGSIISKGYKDKSGTNHLGLEALINSPVYAKANDKTRISRIKGIYEKAYELAKQEFYKSRGNR